MKEGALKAERGKTNHLFDPVLSAPLNLGKFEVDFVQRVRLKCLQFFSDSLICFYSCENFRCSSGDGLVSLTFEFEKCGK